MDLDSDKDGYITVEDFLHNFGEEMKNIDYHDLKKLIWSRSSSKNRGKVSYEDFSAWLGNAIHMSEGFYFRHDSVKNPGYEKAVNRIEKKEEDTRIIREKMSKNK